MEYPLKFSIALTIDDISGRVINHFPQLRYATGGIQMLHFSMRNRHLTLIIFMIAFAILAFPHTNGSACAEDTAPPALTEFGFDPTSIDVSASPGTIIFTLRITDDLSGFQWGGLSMVSPSGQQERTTSFTLASLISGDALDGIYEADISMPQFAEVGTWHIRYVHMQDEMGNIHYLYEADLIALALPTELEVLSGITVEIDIKPGSYPNSINLTSRGVVPVAILTTYRFDVSLVDPDTVTFAGAEPVRWNFEDIDGDGYIDLLFHFNTQDLTLDSDSKEATLSGMTMDGLYFEGSDSVNIVPKTKGK